jgi:hypothetical protein
MMMMIGENSFKFMGTNTFDRRLVIVDHSIPRIIRNEIGEREKE